MLVVNNLAAFNYILSVPSVPLPASLDFESTESDSLSRSYGAGGNTAKGTLSFWLKRESTGAQMGVFGAGTDLLQFTASDQLRLEVGGSAIFVTSTTYTSTAIWYHVLLAWDASLSGTNKIRLKVNGVAPSYGTDNRSGFTAMAGIDVNGTTNYWGRNSGGSIFYDGLAGDLAHYSGSFLDSSDFGTDIGGTFSRLDPPTTGFGTTGSRVDGSSSIGTDVSGNGLNWTNSGTVTSSTVPPAG